MKAEEFYDPFLDDPSDFMLRAYLPRVCGIWFDEAKHENVKAMVDYAKEYGVYPRRFEVNGLRTEAKHLAD